MKTDFSRYQTHTIRAALRLVLTVVILLALGSAQAGPASTAAEPIVIGQSISLYGVEFQASNAIVAGVQAYLQRINAAGGIDGRPVQLVTLDDGGDPDRHADNIRRLIREAKAVAILNCVGDRACSKAAEIAALTHTPLVGPLSGARSLREPRRAFVFPVRTSYAREATTLARQMTTLGVARITVVSDPRRGTEQLVPLQDALRKAGISVSVVEINSDELPAMEQLLKTLQQSHQDAVILDVGPNIYQAMSAAKLGQRSEWPPIVASLADPFVPLLVGIFRGRTIGFSMVVPNPEAASIHLVRDFQRDVERHADGSGVSSAGLEAYVNARICVEGLRRARRPLSGKSMAMALESLGLLDLGGFAVILQPGRPSASDWVDLGVISKSGFYLN